MSSYKYHKLRNIELALVYGKGDFLWVKDSHIQFFFEDRKGKPVHLHGHGDNRMQALLELNALVGQYYRDKEEEEED